MFPSPSPTGQPSWRDVAVYLIATAGLAFCIALLFLGMRVVMGVGGFCAEGGPFVIETPCPPGVEIMFLAAPGIFLFGGLMFWKGAALGGFYPALPLLGWPALFLSLGWNFLEYGVAPPMGEGLVLGWLLTGAIFVLMGGVPLALAVRWRGQI